MVSVGILPFQGPVMRMRIFSRTVATACAVLFPVMGANALTLPPSAPVSGAAAGPGQVLSWVFPDNSRGTFSFDPVTYGRICRLTVGCGANDDPVELAQAGVFGLLDGAGSPDGGIYIFDTATGALLLRLQTDAALEAGDAVALTQEFAAVGRVDGNPDGSNTAAVYLFDGTTGQALRRFSVPGGAESDRFGYSVALNGRNLVVGAPGANGNAGEAYVFDADTGTLLERLTAPAGTPVTGFGDEVAILDDLVAVRGNAGPGGTPTAFLFDRETGDFLGQAPLSSQGGALLPASGTPASQTGQTAALSTPLPAVPLPAAWWLLVAAIGGVVALQRTRA